MDGFKNTTKTRYGFGGPVLPAQASPRATEALASRSAPSPSRPALPAQAASQAIASRPTMRAYKKGGAAKVGKVMGEFKSGELHSGSKKGPEVTNPKQAIAIALSEARKAGAKIPVKKQAGGLMPTVRELAKMTAAERRMLEAEANDVGEMAKSTRAPTVTVKKTTTSVTTPAPKKGVPVASRTPYLPSVTEGAGDESLLEMRRRGMTPGYNKGGKVAMQDGGMASSIRASKDYNASDKDFVASRSQQLSRMVGKAEGGKADLKQDKAMVKAAVHKHEKAMHPGKPMTKLRKGGMAC